NGGKSICYSKSKNKSNEANGYITALYQHFHHHYQPTFDSPSRYPKGLVAPRNSLELTEGVYSIKRKKIASTLMQLMETTGKKSNLRATLFHTYPLITATHLAPRNQT
ncbi:unnamed protein product, partial [Brassica napus]